jgi:hypothetical protein
MSSSVGCSPGLPWLMSYLLESRLCACYVCARVVARSPSWQSRTSYVTEKKHPAGVGNARFLGKTHARMDELTPALPGTVAVLMAYGRRCETAVATQTEVTTTATGDAASPCASEKFENFLADMGEPPLGLTLDRIDNDKGYSPRNCRWATRRQQTYNSTTMLHITLGKKTKHLADWCRELGISKGTYHSRRQRGWGIEEALTTPIRRKGESK